MTLFPILTRKDSTVTRSAQETASFLAAHAAPLPAHVTCESVLATLHAMPNLAARASAIAPNASHESHDDSNGRALFAVTRPRVLDRDGLYTVALCDGRTVAAFACVPTIRGVFDAVIGYLTQALPADCDPAAELESYRASFRDNWEGGLASSAYPTFKASALTQAARWAYRVGAAEAAIAWAEAAIDPEESPARNASRMGLGAFVRAVTAEPARKGLDQLEAEDSAAKAEARAARKGLDQLEAEAARPAVVDVTPTWEGVAGIIALALECGTFEGRKIAREELTRMAKLADSAVAEAKCAEARAEALAVARAKLAQYPDVSSARAGSSLGLVRESARDLRDALAALVDIF